MKRPPILVLLVAALVPALAVAAGSFSVSLRAHVLTAAETPAAVRQSDAVLHRALGMAPASKPEQAPTVTPVAPTTMPAERIPVERPQLDASPHARESARTVAGPHAAPAVAIPHVTPAVTPHAVHLDAREMPAEPLHHPGLMLPGAAGQPPVGPRDGAATTRGGPREGAGAGGIPPREGSGSRDGGGMIPHDGGGAGPHDGGPGSPDRHDGGAGDGNRPHRDEGAGDGQDNRTRHGAPGDSPTPIPHTRPHGGL